MADDMWKRWREEMRGGFIAAWEMEAGNFYGFEAWVGAHPEDPEFGLTADVMLTMTGCI